MGNNQSQNQNKLTRKFSSLPSQNFPSGHSFHSSFIRQSTRSSKRNKKRQLSFNALQKKNGGPLVFVDTLFLPEYPFDSPINDQHFDILRVISTGSFGHVLQVNRRDTGIPFAMKVMNKTQILVDGAVKQCKEEVLIQDAVGHHPFIVKPYWFFQNKDNLFIVMEYIPNGELFSAWRDRGCLGEQLVKLYVAELAFVLDFLHESCIIYRDLKMENILLDAQGHLQVTDFGLAKRLRRGGRTRTICGTMQYIAPEVLNMIPYGHPTDWWSLGILMYAMLVGEYPVNSAANHFEMAKLVQTHVYELPPDRAFTPEARHAVQQLLRHNPSHRVSSLMELKSLPFFDDVNLDALLNRQISPRVYLECPDNAAFFESQESINGSLENLTDSFQDQPPPDLHTPDYNGPSHTPEYNGPSQTPDYNGPSHHQTVPPQEVNGYEVPVLPAPSGPYMGLTVPDMENHEAEEDQREQMRNTANQYFQQQRMAGFRHRRYQSLDMLADGGGDIDPQVWDRPIVQAQSKVVDNTAAEPVPPLEGENVSGSSTNQDKPVPPPKPPKPRKHRKSSHSGTKSSKKKTPKKTGESVSSATSYDANQQDPSASGQYQASPRQRPPSVSSSSGSSHRQTAHHHMDSTSAVSQQPSPEGYATHASGNSQQPMTPTDYGSPALPTAGQYQSSPMPHTPSRHDSASTQQPRIDTPNTPSDHSVNPLGNHQYQSSPKRHPSSRHGSSSTPQHHTPKTPTDYSETPVSSQYQSSPKRHPSSRHGSTSTPHNLNDAPSTPTAYGGNHAGQIPSAGQAALPGNNLDQYQSSPKRRLPSRHGSGSSSTHRNDAPGTPTDYSVTPDDAAPTGGSQSRPKRRTPSSSAENQRFNDSVLTDYSQSPARQESSTPSLEKYQSSPRRRTPSRSSSSSSQQPRQRDSVHSASGEGPSGPVPDFPASPVRSQDESSTLNRSTASSLVHVGNLTLTWNDSLASQEGSFV